MKEGRSLTDGTCAWPARLCSCDPMTWPRDEESANAFLVTRPSVQHDLSPKTYSRYYRVLLPTVWQDVRERHVI